MLLLLLAHPPVLACEYDDCHADGAVSLPDGLEIDLPFEAGERVEVLAGYGPSGGSSLHCRAQDSQCANDYYALDLVLADRSDSGKGQPVLAVADGTVLDADWGSSGWANYGQRVYVEHDPGDGHTYTSMVAHLHSIDVSTGDRVQAGDQLGTLGQSCNGELSCDSFSTPHVHFALHRDSGFGGSGSGGSYGGRAVMPEPLDGATDISRGDDWTSTNGEDEPTDTEPDPTACTVAASGTTVIEEDRDCVARTGSEAAFHELDGHGDRAWWTTVDVEAPDYAEGAIWSLHFEAAGEYDVEAWVPAGVDELTERAIYKLQHDGRTDKAWPDQTAASGWIAVDTTGFASGGDQWVRLGDNHDDGLQAGRRVVFDALRFKPAGEAPDSGSSTDPTDTPTDSDGQTHDSDDRPPDPEPRDSGAGSSEGCGCATGSSPPGPAWVVLGLCLTGWRRRARPRRAGPDPICGTAPGEVSAISP